MAMSKKDFVSLADKIREHNRIANNNSGMQAFSQDQIEMLADFCCKQYSGEYACGFKRERWLKYIAGNCTAKGGPVKAGGK